MSKQLTLFVTFYVKPDSIEAWKVAHRPVWKACAGEPECLYFDVFSDPTTQTAGSEAAVFRLVEIWNASKEWFETQQLTKPYYDTLWQGSKPTWAKPVEIQYFEREGEGCSFRQEFLQGGKMMN